MVKGKCVKTALLVVAIIMLLLMVLWSTIATWLPKLVGLWLPEGTQLVLTQRPELIKRGISLQGIQFLAEDCFLADAGPMTLTYQNRQWNLLAESLDIDTHCLEKLRTQQTEEQTTSPFSIGDIQQQLPLFNITLNRLSVTPWEAYSGKVELTNSAQGQKITFNGNLLSGVASLNNQQQLTLESFSLHIPDSDDVIQLNGEIQVPVSLDAIPEQGNIYGEFVTSYIDKPLMLELGWQQRDGHLFVTPQGEKEKLLDLPWVLSEKRLTVQQGKWQWPYGSQPFSGGVDMTLSDWNSDYSEANIEARLNMVTQGSAGKGNAVLTFAPGKVSLTNSDLNFQLTGKVNEQQMSLYISTPGILTGPIVNPTLRMLSGSLLRAVGPVTPDIYLQEARLPLAGIKITDKGVSGRLQTIISASHRYWGKYKLHLDGRAQEFWLDQGHWEWNFWGNGDMPPLKAKWDMSGRGEWNESLINLQSLSTGFNHLVYGQVTVDKPRLTLSSPLNWQRSQGMYEAGWQLHADKVSFDNGAYLPPSTLNINFLGRDPANFQWKGDLSTDKIGPINLSGRWDGERIRGEAWWPEQSLQVFQTLLPPDLGFKIRGGKLYAQAAFSISEAQGVEAGGHWVVKDGGMWLKDGELSGLDFVMSYRLKDHIWQLGPKSPVKLRVKKLNNLFDMSNITADLQGYYPHSDRYPLRLTNVGVDMLKGHVGMQELRIPQKNPAMLTLKAIDLSELFTILKPKQFTMSGRVDGELPLFLNHPEWLIRNGWIENSNSLTLRLDKDMVQAISDDNMATGDIMDWLRYMEISRSRADVNLSNLGLLTMDAQIKGFNPTKNAERLVELNYHHEEDIFQLWRSLRFGDNLQDNLQQLFSLPVENNQ
ncbi:Dicarboxylate transport [Pragia fontium]|uniref:Dicarboxylate transport n=1 Tax=Pragia fontium DSM 5563 = ATCC 49100 TaxID=1122977 RepID=A0AAJ5BHL7_9GAMM|nr:YdbH family protein [Pragia fontium]SFD00076.1 Dicarboxylate transport [Pragia fontium DSM 5563 = ATCC 49100]SUB82385.1 Dicarboxylate transport [Pragia fontium]